MSLSYENVESGKSIVEEFLNRAKIIKLACDYRTELLDSQYSGTIEGGRSKFETENLFTTN